MTRELYDLLGVEPDATEDEIRAAYRKAAKTAHPDTAGGDWEAFQRLTEALDILTDAARRARYDETGDMSPPSAIRHAKMIGMLDALLGAILTSHLDLATVPMITALKEGVWAMQAQARMEIKELNRRKARVETVRKRFGHKGDAPDLIDRHLKASISNLANMVVEIEDSLDVMDELLVLLADYRYEQTLSLPGFTMTSTSGSMSFTI